MVLHMFAFLLQVSAVSWFVQRVASASTAWWIAFALVVCLVSFVGILGTVAHSQLQSHRRHIYRSQFH